MAQIFEASAAATGRAREPELLPAVPARPDSGEIEKLYELVDGKLEGREMGSSLHSGVGTRLIIRMGMHVETNSLGGVYGADATFQIGTHERLPDVSFLSAARIPEEGETDKKWNVAPDLAVEVISPNDIWDKVNQKVQDYFAAGVRKVWLVSLEQHQIHVFDSPMRMHILQETDDLTDDELLPGFRCPIRDLFKQPSRT